MREIELKGVVDDLDDRRARLLEHGAVVEFVGRLEDRRYDTPDRGLEQGGTALRLRAYRRDCEADIVSLDWKGAASTADGYRTREELSVIVDDALEIAGVLARLGYMVTRTIDRQIEVYRIAGATVRFERYARMDTLVEVEGSPADIEAAIAVLGIPRVAFTSEPLAAFVLRFEARTGLEALVGDVVSGTVVSGGLE